MRPLPLGGDQLTCERIRAAHMARLDSDSPEERLEGLFAMVEDFHEKMNFLQVTRKTIKALMCSNFDGIPPLTLELAARKHLKIDTLAPSFLIGSSSFMQATFDRFLDGASGREGGTLYQLRNLIYRRNVSSKVADNYHANSAFLDLVTDCHVLVAAMQHLEIQNLDDRVVSISPLLAFASVEFKKRVLDNIVGSIIDKYFINKLSSGVDRIESGYWEDDNTVEDKVNNYASNLTQYGLLRKISVLATRSGDGLRQLRHWKFAMLVYDIGHKIKYRLESFILMAGVNALFTERQRHQVIWNRFVNLSGGEGKNLDGDYVMELLNKYAKSRIKQLGPNHSPEVVDKIGKTMMFCHDINVTLEKQIGVAAVSRKHQRQNLVSDRNRIICQLKESNVFQFLPGRSHNHFQNESSDLFGDIDAQALNKWIKLKKMEYSGNKFAF